MHGLSSPTLAFAGVMLAALLSGCSSATLRPVCPPLVTYNRQEQAALAGEIRTHPDLTEMPLFLADYANERNELRAACKP